MKIKSIILIIVLLLIAGCGLTSKETSEDAKHDSAVEIYAITDKGLAISNNNGKKWNTNIQKGRTNGIASSVFNDIDLNEGTVYLSTDKGLSVSTDNMKTFTTYLKDIKINDFVIDGEKLVAATDKGCYITTKNNQYLKISPENQYAKADIFGKEIFALRGNAIESCTINIYVWHSEVIMSEPIKSFAIKDNLFYVLTDKGIYLNDKKLEVPNSTEFYSFYFDNDKNILWVSTNSGLYKSSDDGKSWVVFDKTAGLEEQVINDIYVDNLNIYLATNSGLIHSINAGETWKTYKRQNGMISNKVLDLLVLK